MTDDWMKDFDEAKSKEHLPKTKTGECETCDNEGPLADNGQCTKCYVKGVKIE